MPKFIRKVKNGFINQLIPFEIKKEAVDGFTALTGDVDVGTWAKMIEQNISLWRDAMPDQLRDFLRSGASNYSNWINLANEELVLDWIGEVRPDLKEVLDTQEGRLWFFKQYQEIKQEVGV